jgi:hypothetical protein
VQAATTDRSAMETRRRSRHDPQYRQPSSGDARRRSPSASRRCDRNGAWTEGCRGGCGVDGTAHAVSVTSPV